MGRLGHPDDTDSGEEHGAAHEASRQAGPAAGTCGTEREREGEDGSALRRSRQALSDPSSSPAFAEVWRHPGPHARSAGLPVRAAAAKQP
jgi:hypothetical protein